MKVVHLIDHLGPGGAQTSLIDVVEARGAGMEPSVWCLSDRVLAESRARLTSARVPCEVIGLGPGDLAGMGRLRRRLMEARPDLLHAYLEASSTFGVAGALSLGSTAPLVVIQLVNDLYARPLWARLAGRMLAGRVAGYVAVSPGVSRSAGRAYHGRAGHVAVIPPGIDLRRFDRARADAAAIAGFRRGASRVVGTVGRLADQKALHVLLEATPRLLADDPGTRVLIVGDGPRRPALERQARRLGVDGAVVFAGYQTDVVPAYAAMDVFVLPSRYEGFGIVFLEAMALGVPVVGTRVVGSEDAVVDGVTGLLVPHGDAPALAAAVLRLFADAALREAIRAQAARKVAQDHSRESMAARTESFYRELLHAPAGVPCDV
ncbi:MAG TPA: glycosyltransferase [Gemmatimonadales bacterium]